MTPDQADRLQDERVALALHILVGSPHAPVDVRADEEFTAIARRLLHERWADVRGRLGEVPAFRLDALLAGPASEDDGPADFTAFTRAVDRALEDAVVQYAKILGYRELSTAGDPATAAERLAYWRGRGDGDDVMRARARTALDADRWRRCLFEMANEYVREQAAIDEAVTLLVDEAGVRPATDPGEGAVRCRLPSFRKPTAFIGARLSGPVDTGLAWWRERIAARLADAGAAPSVGLGGGSSARAAAAFGAPLRPSVLEHLLDLVRHFGLAS